MDQFDDLPDIPEKDKRPRFYTEIDGEDWVDRIAHEDPAFAAAHRAWQKGQYSCVEEAVATYKSDNISDELKAEIKNVADQALKRKASKKDPKVQDGDDKDIF